MAERHWVGGTATWNSTVGTKWAATKDGVGGETVPTAADDVFFDSAVSSGTITTSGTTTCVCRSFTITSTFNGNFTFASSTVVTIGDGSGGDLSVAAGKTITIPGTAVKFSFVSTTGGTQTITTGGVTMPQLEVNCGTTTTIQFADNVTLYAAALLTHTQGIWDFNNKTVNAGGYSSPSGTRTLNLGSANCTFINISNNVWNVTTAGWTCNTNTAVITLSGNGVILGSGASANLNGASFIFTGTGTNRVGGTTSLTLGNFSATAPGSTLQFTAGVVYTIGSLTVTGSAGNNITFVSNTAGTAIAITNSSTGALSYCNVQDIAMTGNGVVTATNSTDNGNNRGIDFGVPFIAQSQSTSQTAANPKTLTWVKNTKTGNTIVVASYNASKTVTSITDSQSNTYTKIDSLTTPYVEFWYAVNITGGTTPTVTVNYSGTDNATIAAYELQNVSTTPLDVHVIAAGNSTAANSGATGDTTVASEIAVAYVGTGAGAPTATGTGYTNALYRTSLGMSAKVLTATGPQTGSFTVPTGAWKCGVTTFKAPSAGGVSKALIDGGLIDGNLIKGSIIRC